MHTERTHQEAPKQWDFLAPPYRAIANPDPTGYTWQVSVATPETFELIAHGHVPNLTLARCLACETLERLSYNFEQAKQIGGAV